MFQETITIEEWCAIFDELAIEATFRGSVYTTTGKHPELGHVVGVEHRYGGSVTLVSDMPLNELIAAEQSRASLRPVATS